MLYIWSNVFNKSNFSIKQLEAINVCTYMEIVNCFTQVNFSYCYSLHLMCSTFWRCSTILDGNFPKIYYKCFYLKKKNTHYNMTFSFLTKKWEGCSVCSLRPLCFQRFTIRWWLYRPSCSRTVKLPCSMGLLWAQSYLLL